jgi:hypothetical protein
LTPEYFGEFMRLILLAIGGFWIFMGFLIWQLKGMIEDGGTFIFWLVLDNPYITSAEGRLEHAVFVSKMLLLFGIPTFTIALLLPNPILQEWGSAGILFCIFGALSLKLVFMADAKDRESRHGRKGMDEGEAERIRKLEEEGKIR